MQAIEEKALAAGRSVVYGFITPWSESLGDYAPAHKASPELVARAVKAGSDAVETVRLRLQHEAMQAEADRLMGKR